MPYLHRRRSFIEPPVDKRELNDEFMTRFSIAINFLNIGYLVLLKYVWMPLHKCMHAGHTLYVMPCLGHLSLL